MTTLLIALAMLCLPQLPCNAVMQHLTAWSDPTDGIEATYIYAPNVCDVSHDVAHQTVILIYCED